MTEFTFGDLFTWLGSVRIFYFVAGWCAISIVWSISYPAIKAFYQWFTR